MAKKSQTFFYLNTFQSLSQVLVKFNVNYIFIFLQVNEKSGQIIQYDKFYIHEVQELIDIRNDYIIWVQQQAYGMVCYLLYFMISFFVSFVLIQSEQLYIIEIAELLSKTHFLNKNILQNSSYIYIMQCL